MAQAGVIDNYHYLLSYPMADQGLQTVLWDFHYYVPLGLFHSGPVVREDLNANYVF